MSSTDTDNIQGRRSSLSLKSLYLDPNNYRFIDSESYVQVDEDGLLNPDVQRRTRNLILGKNGEYVRDLTDSFRKNGFLPVDQIQVKQLGDGKYLVVEGNRRVACLKWLQGKWDNEGFDLGKLDPAIFTRLPIVYYQDAEESHHLILMGLKHISGNKKWPPINQAELIRTLKDIHGLSREEICESIAIRTQEYNRIINALGLIDEYKKSEYGDQFSSDRYTLFHDIVRSRAIRDWLQWDYSNFKLTGDRKNLERLFSWISEDEEFGDDDDGLETLKKLEPVISRAGQIKELAKLITDETALANLDTTRNLSEATLASEVLSKDKIKNAVSIIGQEVNTLFNMARHMSDANRVDLAELSQKISAILETGKTQEISASNRRYYLYEEKTESQFTEIKINEFRRLRNIYLPEIARINLFAGINNSGKTTVLEAVKLIASLNNPREFIDLVKQRAKIPSSSMEMGWFLEQVPEAELQGTFNGEAISLHLGKKNSTVEDMTYYLQSAGFEISVGNNNWSSLTHFYEKYPQRTEGQTSALCPSVFSSPFSGLDPELLRRCHGISLKAGSKQTIIRFITKHIDPDIQGIELDDSGRFTVVHKRISPNPDLTKFGEGLQRIFKMGLLFAGARNGIVMIDEFENAILASLLPKLVELIYDLACQFNVQVFLSSHSKECIDAFTNSEKLPLQDLSTYGLVEEDIVVKCAHFPGVRLNELVSTIDFDLRGGKDR